MTKTYDVPRHHLGKLQGRAPQPFSIYDARTRIEETDTQVLAVPTQIRTHQGEVALWVMVAILLILVALGVILATFLFS